MGSLTFLVGQRASGRTPREVDECHEQVELLEGARRDLAALADDAARDAAASPARDTLDRAQQMLDETIARLRRGADLLV